MVSAQHEAGAARPDWQASTSRRLQVRLIAGVGAPIIRVLGSTWRWRVEGAEHLETATGGGQPAIHAFWHGRILPGTIYFKDRGIVVITSQNFDGEWIARIIHKFGFGTARGSSSRGARRALMQLVRDVKSRSVAFSVDGPRGPAEVAQPGALWLSKVTGHPVLPFHFEAASHWSLKSWDRTQIPKPFTTVAVVFAPPFVVPPASDDGVLEEYRKRLERDLAACALRCRDLVG